MPPLGQEDNLPDSSQWRQTAHGRLWKASTTVKSGGRNWFNWGTNYSESMELRANVEWDVQHSRDKTYFKPYEGLPKVFHAKTKETDGAASAVVFSKTYHAKAESLTAAEKVVYPRPEWQQAGYQHRLHIHQGWGEAGLSQHRS